MLSLQLLPARQGDAIWVRWTDRAGAIRNLMVDMGTVETGRVLRERLAGERFELLVVTHIDSDHIGGVLSCLVSPPNSNIEFADIWFNGLDHCYGRRAPRIAPPAMDPLGGVQGRLLMDYLATRSWNEAFDRGPVVRDDEPASRECHGLKITVLGPTPARLQRLAPRWEQELRDALVETAAETVMVPLGGLAPLVDVAMQPLGGVKPQLPPLDMTWADGATGDDDSLANGSSIVLLLEHHEGHRVLLSGDAFASDLIAGLAAYREGRIPLDAFKLPHHGSKKNINRELLEVLDCSLYLFSTDGTRFAHPDEEAIACVLKHGGRAPRLGFNVRSDRNLFWEGNVHWVKAAGYTPIYGDDDEGLMIELRR